MKKNRIQDIISAFDASPEKPKIEVFPPSKPLNRRQLKDFDYLDDISYELTLKRVYATPWSLKEFYDDHVDCNLSITPDEQEWQMKPHKTEKRRNQ